MRRYLIPLLLIWLVIGMLGAWQFTIDSADVSQSFNQAPSRSVDNMWQTDWQSVLKKVPDYYKAPPPLPPQTSKEGAPKPKPVPKVIPPTITDAKLMGIVKTSPPQILLVLPKAAEPTKLNAGESWLAPWTLDEVMSDRVVWRNMQTQETLTQFLFAN